MLESIESTDPTQIQVMIDTISNSSSAESRQNGDMEELDGKIDLAYTQSNR